MSIEFISRLSSTSAVLVPQSGLFPASFPATTISTSSLSPGKRPASHPIPVVSGVAAEADESATPGSKGAPRPVIPLLLSSQDLSLVNHVTVFGDRRALTAPTLPPRHCSPARGAHELAKRAELRSLLGNVPRIGIRSVFGEAMSRDRSHHTSGTSAVNVHTTSDENIGNVTVHLYL